MASVDLRDAHFSIPVYVDHPKYLKFIWKGTLYQLTYLPQGLGCSPRVFTKGVKYQVATLTTLSSKVIVTPCVRKMSRPLYIY